MLDFRLEERMRQGQTWLMQTAPGVPTRWFLHELALELHMPVGEMCSRMSAHELNVEWPAFFAARERERKHLAEKENQRRRTLTG